MMRHLPPTATPMDRDALRAAFTARDSDVNRFRSALEGFLGASSCFPAASGRTALYMLLATLKQHSPQAWRTQVILPAYTCPSVAKVVVDAGLEPHLVDIAPHTFSYNLTEFATAISTNTLAVVVVHPFGMPLPVEEICSLAEAHGVQVIEDCAQSMGARVNGRRAGTLADFGLFSLGPGKPLSTGGGGFICTSSEAGREILRDAWRRLPAPSAANSKLAAVRLSMLGAAFHPTGWWMATRLGAQRVGENEAAWRYTMQGLSPAQAAAGLRLLPKLDDFNSVRRRNGQLLTQALGEISGIQLPCTSLEACHTKVWLSSAASAHSAGDNCEAIYLRYPVLFESEEAREKAVTALNAAGIGVGRMYRRTLASLFPQYAEGVYPGAERVAHCLLTLPTHHYVRESDIARMAEIVTSCANADSINKVTTDVVYDVRTEGKRV